MFDLNREARLFLNLACDTCLLVLAILTAAAR
jgi:hypothetical protein